MEKKKILIVDDDSRLVKYLADFLTGEGFQTTVAMTGNEAITTFTSEVPNLIILDVSLPDIDGFELCRIIREKSDVPIIFLTAKTEIVNKVLGFALGSDDYLTKPFNNTELLLRIKAILRRGIKTSSPSLERVQLPSLTIEYASRVVELDGQEIELSQKEFELLWLLASHSNQVFTRQQLVNLLWNTEYSNDTAVVTTLVKRLRDKISNSKDAIEYIKTVHGVGYKLGVKPC